jgi:hypothetical protein
LNPHRKARNEALAKVAIHGVKRRWHQARGNDAEAARHLKWQRRWRRRAQQALADLRASRSSLGYRPKLLRAPISPSPIFGGLGRPVVVTGHHSAGPKDQNDAHAIRLVDQYDAQHRAQGWGGLGYHFNVTRAGNIVLGRPIGQKGAHVGGHNSGNVGVLFHGTTGDQPTEPQRKAFRWLLENAHTSKMPASHRSAVKLLNLRAVGHNDWSGHQSNACPGTHKRMIVRKGATV